MLSQKNKQKITDVADKETMKLLKKISIELDESQKEFDTLLGQMAKQKNGKMASFYATKLSSLQNQLSDLSISLLEVSELQNTSEAIVHIEASILTIDKRVNTLQDKIKTKKGK